MPRKKHTPDSLAADIHLELGKVLLQELKSGSINSSTLTVCLNYAKAAKITSDEDTNPYMSDILDRIPFSTQDKPQH